MKIVKKTWIAILAVLTAVVAACTATKRTSENNNSTGAQPSDNDNLVADKEKAVHNDSISVHRAEMQERLEKLRAIIHDREMSCVYGSPEVLKEYSAHTRELRQEADSLQNVLLNMLESEKQSLNERLQSIDETIKVYGPPEMINKYNARNKDLQEQRDSIQKEMEKIDVEISNIKNNN